MTYFAFAIGGEVANLVRQSGPVAQTVLLLLLAFSLLSWAIILAKWSRFGRARTQSGRFIRAFRKAHRLQDIAGISDQFKPSPLVAVLIGVGISEYLRTVGGPWVVSGNHLVDVPVSEGITGLKQFLTTPDFRQVFNPS